MKRDIRVVQVGLGWLGARVVNHIVSERQGLRYVGALDVAAELEGSDLGMVAGLKKKLGVKISNNPEKLFKETRPDIAIYTTGSFIKDVLPQMKSAIVNGINIISSCEQLSFPSYSSPKLATEYDRLSKKHGVSVLGTGINPGFLMDARAIALTAACTSVERIEITREMNASLRRRAFQKKIGTALKPAAFKRAIKTGAISGHVGLEESICLIAEALGWELDRIKVEPPLPLIAEKKVRSQHFSVERGEVKGVHQEAYGLRDGEGKIHLVFQAYLGADPSYDEVIIEGVPPITARVSPCWQGDDGTVAVMANLIPAVLNAPPGLITMNDLSALSFHSGNFARLVNKRERVS